MVARNELASYMMRKRVKAEGESPISPAGQAFLPPTIDDDYKCAKCYVVDGCMLYRKVSCILRWYVPCLS
jgi:DNA replication ATP-dependent helicase Dna2